MKNYNTLLLEPNPPILAVKLNRPLKANAINNEMISELSDLSSQLRYETQFKFIVFSGEGKTFSGGADLGELDSEIASGMLSQKARLIHGIDGNDCMQKIENLEQITIAAINGPNVWCRIGFGLGV